MQEGDTNPTGVNGPPDLTVTIQSNPCGSKPKFTISNNDDPQTIILVVLGVGVGSTAPALGAMGPPTVWDFVDGIPIGTALGVVIKTSADEADSGPEHPEDNPNPQQGPFLPQPAVPAP